jgi:hypothetical protein
MHARVATFEGDPSTVDQMIEGIKKDVESGDRPPGLEEAAGVMILVDRKTGKSVGITFFEDEEGLKRGDEALNKMSPDPGSSMRRSSVEFYEVPIQQMN